MTTPQTNTSDTDTVSLAGYAKVLLQRKWIIVGVVAMMLGVTLAYSYLLATPTYRSTAGVLRQTTSFDQALFNTSVFDLRDAQRDLQTGARLVKLDTVAGMVKEDLGSPRSKGSLLAMTSVVPESSIDIINISSASADPSEAAAVANSFANQFILYRQAADRATLAQARAQVEQELAGMTTAQRESERGTVLTQKAEELRILETMQTGGFEVVQQAVPAGSPFSPKPTRNVLFALVASLILGILIAFIVDQLDRRIKTEEALEREFGLPVLAVVPRVGRRWISQKSKGANAPVGFPDVTSRLGESFRTLRSNLKYFELDRAIRTIVVTSGLPQEGKTVTTVNLAISLALSGARVVVIEADLRRPMVSTYLGLSDGVGVSNILAGTHPLASGLQLVKISDFAPTNGRDAGESAQRARLERNFYCVTSGPLPPNPAELIGSEQMATLVVEAASNADYVLIDTPPVLLVADTLSLVGLADAVLISCRINSTTIEEAHEVRTLLQRSGARTLGLVAGGVRSAQRGRYHRYGKGYYATEQ